MLKRLATVLLIVFALTLQSCVGGGTAFQSYADQYEGYEFVYPTGWVEVQVPGSADVVFHDIVNETENVSVVISEVPEGKTLEDLGTPTDVGYKLSKSFNVIAAGESDVELVSAQAASTPPIARPITSLNMSPIYPPAFATTWPAPSSAGASCSPSTPLPAKTAGKR